MITFSFYTVFLANSLCQIKLASNKQDSDQNNKQEKARNSEQDQSDQPLQATQLFIVYYFASRLS
jgi:hypothetical protein